MQRQRNRISRVGTQSGLAITFGEKEGHMTHELLTIQKVLVRSRGPKRLDLNKLLFRKERAAPVHLLLTFEARCFTHIVERLFHRG